MQKVKNGVKSGLDNAGKAITGVIKKIFGKNEEEKDGETRNSEENKVENSEEKKENQQ